MPDTFDLTYIVMFLVVLVITISVHEFMHAYAGKALGDDTADEEGRLSLNPLRHIDPILTIAMPLFFILLHQPPLLAAKPVPFRPEALRYGEWGSALVALAGPVSNLLLAVLGAIIFHVLPPGTSSLLYNFVVLFVTVNISVFIFNLIPLPPLDGSRVLYAVAPDGVRRVMDVIEGFGLLSVVILVVILFPLISPVLSSVNQALLRFLLV
ncbi:MAG: zinc metalloprotease ywhC [Candidatus Saccharibacteria bacterium]|nr:zinc metalloprotease ywhC [Candidatus Saccharibacteria bacterium]